MSDLISRSALLNEICKQFNIPNDWDGDIAEPLQTVIDIIDNFKISYDVEKVVAELEELISVNREAKDTLFNRDDIARHIGAINAFDDAIDIVRKGGVE